MWSLGDSAEFRNLYCIRYRNGIWFDFSPPLLSEVGSSSIPHWSPKQHRHPLYTYNWTKYINLCPKAYWCLRGLSLHPLLKKHAIIKNITRDEYAWGKIARKIIREYRASNRIPELYSREVRSIVYGCTPLPEMGTFSRVFKRPPESRPLARMCLYDELIHIRTNARVIFLPHVCVRVSVCKSLLVYGFSDEMRIVWLVIFGCAGRTRLLVYVLRSWAGMRYSCLWKLRNLLRGI